MPAIVIHVKVLGVGKNPLTVLVNDSDRICVIKEKLSHQLFVPVDEQSLIFNGKTLDNEKSLTSENLKDGCLVHLLLLKTHTHFDFTSRLHKFLSNSLPDDKKSMLITEHCVNYICDFIDSLSLDEIERYAKQKCLSSESSAGSSSSS
ncbi:ubiquitin domain containing protein [Trichuris trichiura]|uniref:Ubiquitin domain containing protein n=1 Tax=Trichuris trichiura TaxID=36087 RepID=A0A077Z4U2_TRITR|nr:ubiquitin domain containing protein [Trichuris trichiura]